MLTSPPIPSPDTLQTKFSWENIISEESLLNSETVKDSSIPKIIHQTWKTTEIPEKFRIWRESWVKTHSDWTMILWTDADNQLLIEKYYPEVLHLYKSFYLEIERVDFSRLLYLHRYGGIYADLDTYAIKYYQFLLRNTEPLLNNDLVFGSLSEDPNFYHNIPNAWMASVPRDEFWKLAISQVRRRNLWNWGAEYITGTASLI
jgi:mannosyltransferase OCH1-like enzyme